MSCCRPPRFGFFALPFHRDASQRLLVTVPYVLTVTSQTPSVAVIFGLTLLKLKNILPILRDTMDDDKRELKRVCTSSEELCRIPEQRFLCIVQRLYSKVLSIL